MSWIGTRLRQAVSNWDAQEMARLKSYYDKRLFRDAIEYLRFLLGDSEVSNGDDLINGIILRMEERQEEMTQENLLRRLPI